MLQQLHNSICPIKKLSAAVLCVPRQHPLQHRSLVGCSAAAMSGPVLVHDNAVGQAPASAQALLAQNRDWSYTTALVREGRFVVDWELHLERLERNIKVLGQQRPPAYADFLAWMSQQSSSASIAEALQQVINPQIATALQLLAEQEGANEAPIMLMVLVTDPPGPSKAGSSQQPLSVQVWANYLPPASPAKPAKVLVSGGPRLLAQAKHCDWVVTRRSLEQLKSEAGADEVILSDESGALLEGLVSNWYVIADEAGLAAGTAAGAAAQSAASASSERLPGESAGSGATAGTTAAAEDQIRSSAAGRSVVSGLVLLTTGSRHAALPGVTQQRVLQACERIGLKVLQQPAQPEQQHAWREAFLSNCVKGIQPVASVQLSPDTVWHMPPDCGAVTKLLQRALMEVQSQNDLSGVEVQTTGCLTKGFIQRTP